jgi:DNA repair exonuclease SbcCD nuclease subunit
MTAQEILLDALKRYKIEVLAINGNHIKLQHNFEVEVEANGVYKLLDDGYIVAPFIDINELCRFILM